MAARLRDVLVRLADAKSAKDFVDDIVPYGKIVIKSFPTAAAIIASAVDGRYGDFLLAPPRWGALELAKPADMDREPWAEVWLSKERSACQAHQDAPDSALLVVAGSKEVAIGPPSMSKRFRSCDLQGQSQSKLARGSKHEPLNAVGARIDGWAKTTLHPGDAMFIPAKWWHQISSVGGTVAISIPVGLRNSR